MTHDTLYTILLLGAKTFSTMFVLGVASIIFEVENNDDDDDGGGGMLQPVYVRNR